MGAMPVRNQRRRDVNHSLFLGLYGYQGGGKHGSFLRSLPVRKQNRRGCQTEPTSLRLMRSQTGWKYP
jgi:hypothetical protein